MPRKPYVIEYTRDEVEKTLEAMWNEGDSYTEYMPEGGMPKSEANPAHRNTMASRLIDVGRGLRLLSTEQQGDLFLRFGQGWRFWEIASYRGSARQTATERIDASVGVIVDYLNGTGVWAQ